MKDNVRKTTMTIVTHTRICIPVALCVLLATLGSTRGNEQHRVAIQRNNDEFSFSFGNFFSHNNSYLDVEPVSRSMEESNEDCCFKCLDEKECLSYNIAATPDPITSLYWCELLATDKYDSSDNFKPENTSSRHYSIKNPCLNMICNNRSRCNANYNNNTGRCVCRKGFVGQQCERYCAGALGMENRKISDQQLTASSVYDSRARDDPTFYNASSARLNNAIQHGWSAKTLDTRQWLQIKFKNITIITALATQGYRNTHVKEWVTSYQISFSQDSLKWQVYKEGSSYKTFVGNSDRNTIVRHDLDAPFYSKYLRFLPKTWHRHISMRVEVYGCTVT